MGDSLETRTEALNAASESINSTIGSLGGVGFDMAANVGRGFSQVGMTPEEAGKSEVQKSSEEFAERWSTGVRSLGQAANNIAVTLDLSAGLYNKMEDQIEGAFKVAVTNSMGNPHLSEDEIHERSWGETWSDNPINHQMNPDYSAESFQESRDHINANNETIKEVGPQALANITAGNPTMQDVQGLPAPAWNSGLMENAAQEPASQTPAPQPAH